MILIQFSHMLSTYNLRFIEVRMYTPCGGPTKRVKTCRDSSALIVQTLYCNIVHKLVQSWTPNNSSTFSHPHSKIRGLQNWDKYYVKCNGDCCEFQRAYRERRGIAQLIPKLGTRWVSTASVALGPIYLRERNPIFIEIVAGWASRFGTDGFGGKKISSGQDSSGPSSPHPCRYAYYGTIAPRFRTGINTKFWNVFMWISIFQKSEDGNIFTTYTI
jgi:hypothetical protein